MEFTVKGELRSGTPRMYSEYMVELQEPTQRGASVKAEVRNDGGFEVRHIQPGEYFLVVTTLTGEPVHTQSVSLTPQTGPIDVRLPDVPVNRPGARTVSVKQLLHPPTK